MTRAHQTDPNWQELWHRDKSGALQKIFHQYHHLLWQRAFRLLEDRGLAEDIIQEIFLRLWRMDSLDHVHGELGAYLMRSVTNRCLNRIKERRRVAFPGDEQPIPDRGRSSDPHEQKHLRDAISRAVQELPDRCRLVFVMSKYEGLTNQQIADLLEISVKTVENQMTKAFKLLRSSLSEELNRNNLSGK